MMVFDYKVEDETGGKKSLRMKIAVARIEYTQEN